VARPRVSVLLPVRDAAPTLPACLDSLRAQTLGDFEVIAVDDGSRDESAALLARAAREDRRLRVIAGSGGLVAALNAAAAAAGGELLARMDADDVALPERFARQVAVLDAAREIDILGCRVALMDGGAFPNAGMRAYVQWSNGLLTHEAIAADRLVESPLAHPSVMMRAAVLRDLGGYRAFDGPEDYDLWLRALHAGRRLEKVPEVLLQWRDAPSRLSRTDPRYAPGRFFDLKREAFLRLVPSADGVVVWGAGPIGKAWARGLRERGRAVRAFVDVDPRKIGRTVHGAPVVGVEAAGAYEREVHLAAVGSADARRRIRAAAAALGIERVVAVA
jgi:glycosyltransferase involved in cell wall biosynthesis